MFVIAIIAFVIFTEKSIKPQYVYLINEIWGKHLMNVVWANVECQVVVKIEKQISANRG